MSISIAVVIPCHNEALTIGKVVADFREALPGATIYVFDNCSSDNTAEVASTAGAIVYDVALRGKGNVVRRMFADVDADIYVLVDGDDTYCARSSVDMVKCLLERRLDMVVGLRVSDDLDGAYRRGHRFGNIALTRFVQRIFGGTFRDMLSGYRVFSKRFVKSFPAVSKGFEIETELTIHALEIKCPCGEIETRYGTRPDGSSSKLSTYSDGFRIMKLIVRMYMHERPLPFYGIFSSIVAAMSIILSIPIIIQFIDTGLVERIPTAVLCASMMVIAIISLACGLILSTVTKGRSEARSLAYLSYPGPNATKGAVEQVFPRKIVGYSK